MFLESKDFLTVWDIAHRWAGYGADATNPDELPEEVSYWIHKLILGYVSKDLIFRRKNGYRVPEDAAFVFLFNINLWQKRLWKCLTKNVFEKPFLNSLYVMRSQVIRWCEKGRILDLIWAAERVPITQHELLQINLL